MLFSITNIAWIIFSSNFIAVPPRHTRRKVHLSFRRGGEKRWFFPPPMIGMFWSLSRKSSKYNYTQCLGRGFRSDVRLRFWPLFVNSNGILGTFTQFICKILKEVHIPYELFRSAYTTLIFVIYLHTKFMFRVECVFWIHNFTPFCNLKRYFNPFK